MEAEYMALAEATKEAKYLRTLIGELEFEDVVQELTISVCIDNQGAISLAENPVHHNRSKHIDIKYHFVREALKDKIISIKYLRTEDMPADAFTKGLGKLKIERFNGLMGIRSR